MHLCIRIKSKRRKYTIFNQKISTVPKRVKATKHQSTNNCKCINTKVQSTVNLVVTENSLKTRPSLNSSVIKVVIKVISGDTTSTIRFPYNITHDTPEIIAQEMRVALSLPESYIIAIQSQIRAAGNIFVSKINS